MSLIAGGKGQGDSQSGVSNSSSRPQLARSSNWFQPHTPICMHEISGDLAPGLWLLVLEAVIVAWLIFRTREIGCERTLDNGGIVYNVDDSFSDTWLLPGLSHVFSAGFYYLSPTICKCLHQLAELLRSLAHSSVI